MSNDAPVTQQPKRFVPLENNPEVMSALLHNLGLSRALAFHDVYSISDPALLSFVPRPAHALLLVFPVSATYEAFRRAEDAPRETYAGAGPGEPVLWFRQTVGNACGLIALLHAAGSSGGARAAIAADSPLAALLAAAEPLGPDARAALVEQSGELEAAHAAAASGGDTAAPAAEASVDLHFVCFVASRGRLWELDGRRKGPLDRGPLGGGEEGNEGDEEEDVLSEKALDLGVRAFLRREEEAGGGDLRFSLIALAPALD